MARSKFLSIFKDPRGTIVIWQTPNVPLIGWAAARVATMLLHEGAVKTGFSYLATAFLFTWAYFEVRSGVNIFRKLLGIAVLILIIVSFF